MKLLKRIFLFLIITLALFVGTVVVIATLYKDEVIKFVQSEIGEKLTREVKFSSMDYSLFSDFPNVAVTINDIETHSFKKGDVPFVKLKRIDLIFDLLPLISGEFIVGGIHLNEGAVNILLNEEGVGNYNIIESSKDSSSSATFSINKVKLKGVNFSYQDAKAKSNYEVAFNEALLYPSSLQDSIVFNGHYEGVIKHLITGNDDLVQSAVASDADIEFFRSDKKMVFLHNGQLAEQDLNVAGAITNKVDGDFWDFKAETRGLLIDSVLPVLAGNILPSSMKSVDGELDAKLSIIGYNTTKILPALTIDFTLKNSNAVIGDESIKNVRVEGKYSQSNLQKYQTGVVDVKQFYAEHNGLKFSGACKVKDFDAPFFDGAITSRFNLSQLHTNYFKDDFVKLEGEAFIDADLKGRLLDIFVDSDFRQLKSFKSNGKLDIDNAIIQPKDFDYPITLSTSKLSFTDKDILVGLCIGAVNSSSFSMRGEIKDYLKTMLQNHPMHISTDIEMNQFILEEFVTGDSTTVNADSTAYHFNLPSSLQLATNIKLGKFSFRSFEATDVTGDVQLLNQKLKFSNINFKTCEGLAKLNGTINSKHKEKVVFKLKTSLDKIDAKQAFVAFENFGQDVLLSKHVKGKVSIDSYLLAQTDKALNLDENKIYTETFFEIDNGELIGFEPLIDLEEFLNKDLKLNFDLKHLKFSKLKNTIDVNQGVISIPEMMIASNQIDLNLQGSHTFNQDIDYKLQVKHSDIFKAKRANKIDAEYGVVENDDKTATLPLRMFGNMDDPKFGYDVKTKKDIVTENLKKEGKAIKQILKDELGVFFKGKKAEEVPDAKPPKTDNKVTPQIIWDESPDDEDEEEEEEESELYESDMKYQTSEYLR